MKQEPGSHSASDRDGTLAVVFTPHARGSLAPLCQSKGHLSGQLEYLIRQEHERRQASRTLVDTQASYQAEVEG